MSTSIYIIQGNTGEYSDRQDWLVSAHLDKFKALAKLVKLNEKLNELGLSYDQGRSRYYKSDNDMKLASEMKKFDDQFLIDYTGSGYVMLEVELEE